MSTTFAADDASLDTYQVINKNLKIFAKENLGSGAFGEVFKGSYRNEPCAVKVLHQVAMLIRTKLSPGEGNRIAIEAFNRECEFSEIIPTS